MSEQKVVISQDMSFPKLIKRNPFFTSLDQLTELATKVENRYKECNEWNTKLTEMQNRQQSIVYFLEQMTAENLLEPNYSIRKTLKSEKVKVQNVLSDVMNYASSLSSTSKLQDVVKGV